MAQLTDRVSPNQNIIDIAKQQWETTKRNTIPTEIVQLPSAGKIYPKTSPLSSGQLEMRYMTAYDEDILTNASFLREGIVLDKLLTSLIVTPGVLVDDIATADKDALIIQARILSYGAEYPVKVLDPSTDTYINRTVNLTELKFIPFNLESDELGEFDYEINADTKIKFSFLRSKHNKTSVDDQLISNMLNNMITEVNGSRKTNDIVDFIRYKFLARDAKKFRDWIQANSPSINLETKFEGEDGGTFISKFQLGSDIFWF
jgi:hypothetical protein